MLHTYAEWRHFESMDEIEALDCYVPDIDDKQTDFDKLIGWYRFKDVEVRCGRKSCHEPHKFGFVVRTLDRRHVIVGNICGVRLFGERFETEVGRLDQHLDEAARILKAEELLSQRERIAARVKDLRERPFGVGWVMRARGTYLGAIGERLANKLTKRSATLEAEITRDRLRTDNDPPPSHPWEEYISETIGRLRGIGALRYDPARIIDEEIARPLGRFGNLTAADIVHSRKERNHFTRFVNNLYGAFDRIEGVLKDARKFFTPENHVEVLKLATPQERRSLEGLSWDDETGLPVFKERAHVDPSSEAERRRDEEYRERIAERERIREYFRR